MKYSIRPLSCLDVKSAADIFRVTFQSEEHKEFSPIWRDRTKKESVGVFNDDGDLLGFILIFENQQSLKYIAVHPQFQAFGIGSILLRHALIRCIEKGESLNLVPANDTVQGWYERQGFIVTSWIKTKDGKTWPLMNFHTYGTRRQEKNLKRLHEYIQNERPEADNFREQVGCWKYNKCARDIKYVGGLNSDNGAAGTSKSFYDHQDVARSEQGGVNVEGTGA